MSRSYPGHELSVEQLVYALTQAQGQNAPSRRQFLESGLQKTSDVEQDLSEVLRETRTIRNVCVPINKLPPEILASFLDSDLVYELVLVDATHVCRYWRSTLLSSPSLWTSLRFSSRHLNRTLTYLERSKSAPIDIKVDMNFSRDLEAFRHLALHIARTRSLYITGYHTPTVHAASLILRTPSPSLQYLSIYSRRGFVRLSDDFLGQQAPLLRSLTFDGIHPGFESHLPLPSLVEFKLCLPEGAGPFRIDALFRSLSGCPWLQKICIKSKETSQDITLDQIISLESLVELDYTYRPAGRVLPCLRLPRLKKLSVSSSFGSGQEQSLASLLPHGGHALLTGVTKMSYWSYDSSLGVKFSGKGTDVSFDIFRPAADHALVGWLFDEACIPFGQIEDLKVGGFTTVDFPINFPIFKNLKVLRIILLNAQLVETVLRSLHPHPETGTPCRPLQRILCACWESLGPLVNLARERKRVGHRLRSVWIHDRHKSNQDLVEELEQHVDEVRG